MFRHIVVSTFFAIFTVGSVAQALGDKPTEPAQKNADQPARSHKLVRSPGAADGRISIVRLMEPPKARLLLSEAMNAWKKQKSAEAEHRLEDALKIYSPFPEALTFYGGIQASLQHWSSAEESVQAAIQADPDYFPAYIVLAGVYNAQTRFDDAEKATQQALAAGA